MDFQNGEAEQAKVLFMMTVPISGLAAESPAPASRTTDEGG
jgi:hypothetical protein